MSKQTAKRNYNPKANRNYKDIAFFKKWLNTFATDISAEQYTERIHGQYIWHAFSFRIIDKSKYLSGNAARNAYNLADKTDAVSFELWYDEKPRPLPEQYDTAEKIESDDGTAEIYIAAKDFSWTYVVTHETDWGCGPYFMQINK